MLTLSRLENVLRDELQATEEEPRHFFLYGDAGYDGSTVVASPIALRMPGVPAGSHKAANAARVSIENVFGAKKGKAVATAGWAADAVAANSTILCPLIGTWAFTKFSDNLKIQLSPIGDQMLAGALLYNCINCISPRGVSLRFGIPPPTLEEYLQLMQP